MLGMNPPFPDTTSVNMPEAELTLMEGLFTVQDSALFAERLDQDIDWRQDHIRLFGKTMPLPRLTAWHGDPGRVYSYSGIEMPPKPWTESLLSIKARVETAAGTQFNSVLLNKYRDGRDSMGWHSDDEPELGPSPVIASVSFGATRRFVLKHKYNKTLETISMELTDGSLLLMQGTTQHFWQHQVPKTRRVVGQRINLTFRTIV
jgi:alkylated DNA repair dioxygenase AlkB